MLLALLILTFSMKDPHLFIEETDIYLSILSHDFAVASDHHVYILDKQEFKILHFDEEGKRFKDIGGKGQAPGEFNTRPSAILVEEGFLYVFESRRRKIHQYKTNGVFVKSMQAPVGAVAFGNTARRVGKAWFFTTLTQDALIQSDSDFKEMFVIEGRANLDSLLNQKIQFEETYNPAKTRIFFSIGPDRMVYYTDLSGTFRINVYDPILKKAVRTIERPFTSVPVDPSWAESIYENYSGGVRSRGLKNLNPRRLEYPSHFPAIMDMKIGWDHRIHIRTSKQFLGKDMPSDLYDLNGKHLGLGLIPEKANRVLSRMDPWLYVSSRKDDELQILKLHLDESGLISLEKEQ
ncbi:MAG: 6-bladed beta-propeller [Acidobacteriota bacterium]|nr:6-bladed beta-propeller [Acidobacteriota bacterium]